MGLTRTHNFWSYTLRLYIDAAQLGELCYFIFIGLFFLTDSFAAIAILVAIKAS